MKKVEQKKSSCKIQQQHENFMWARDSMYTNNISPKLKKIIFWTGKHFRQQLNFSNSRDLGHFKIKSLHFLINKLPTWIFNFDVNCVQLKIFSQNSVKHFQRLCKKCCPHQNWATRRIHSNYRRKAQISLHNLSTCVWAERSYHSKILFTIVLNINLPIFKCVFISIFISMKTLKTNAISIPVSKYQRVRAMISIVVLIFIFFSVLFKQLSYKCMK